MAFAGLGAGDLQNVKSTLTAENLGNSADVELRWAMKASEHADIYFNLVSSVDPALLRLTKHDDELHTKFLETFPDMKIDVLDENDMKNKENKEKWRLFMEEFKEKIEDYITAPFLDWIVKMHTHRKILCSVCERNS